MQKISIYDAIVANKRRTWFLMAGFVALLAALGYAFDYFISRTGQVFIGFLAFALLWTVLSYFFSARLALAVNGAKPANKQEYPFLFNTVEGLSIAAGIPVPKVYVINSEAMNAFATGRDPKHSAVAFTSGLLKKMNRQELEGVVAHEISHIANYDIRIQTIAVMLAGFIVIIADILMRYLWWSGLGFGGRDRDSKSGLSIIVIVVISILAAVFAELLKFAISRQREYLADATGALLTRNPDGLASALEKIANDTTPLRQASEATAHLFIVNPFKKRSLAKKMVTLFSTHPPVEERIARLRSM